MPCPIPDVPPTNTATGFVNFAADVRFIDAAKDAIGVDAEVDND